MCWFFYVSTKPPLYPLPLIITPKNSIRNFQTQGLGFACQTSEWNGDKKASNGEIFLHVSIQGRLPLSSLSLLFLDARQLWFTSKMVTSKLIRCSWRHQVQEDHVWYHVCFGAHVWWQPHSGFSGASSNPSPEWGCVFRWALCIHLIKNKITWAIDSWSDSIAWWTTAS
jgi:hypothetical protein